MATGFQNSSEVDFDDLFDPYVSGTKPAATGLRINTNVDLRDRYAPLSAGSKGPDTGFQVSGGADVSTLWAAKGTSGGTDPGGPGGGGCLPRDTPVMLWHSGTKQIGDLMPGDVLVGYYREGMIDEEVPNWRTWTMPRDSVGDGVLIPVTVARVMLDSYHAYYLINGELRVTYEHVFLVLRDAEWGWRKARDLKPGDAFMSADLTEVQVESVEYVEQPLEVADIDVEEVDNYLFEAFGGTSILSHNSDQKT